MANLPMDRMGMSIRLMLGTGMRGQEILALGVDLQTIQSIVGHADVDMTERYLKIQEPKRLEAVDLFSKAFGIPRD